MSDPTHEPTEEEISNVARHLWEDEGQPDGKAEEHWSRAQEQLRRRYANNGQNGDEPQNQ